ncbi:taurine ABC transporter ATP-binding protein [Piscinibacter sp.]|uniref:taurine ABC transporter ATP-binding protein n=1 Tax=Piscinibacter sp. TaxID=1903157 RepID=UPI0039E5BDC9
MAGYGDDAGSTTVLDALSLTIPDGGITVLLGPSGCGKSSLLNLIAGFVPLRAGRASVSGRNIDGPGADRGVVFQDDALLPWLDVLGNVALPLRLRGLDRAAREERARHFLDLVGLRDHADRRVWELSGGMRQRVGIARALAADPEVLLMDEPFGALDALTRERMQELLLRVWTATGKTIVLVTHGVEEAVFLATELVLLSPRPARIVEQRPLAFSRRFAAGEPARRLKSLPEFVAVREQVLGAVFALEDRAA